MSILVVSMLVMSFRPMFESRIVFEQSTNRYPKNYMNLSRIQVFEPDGTEHACAG